MTLAFYIAAAVALVSTLMVVSRRNPIHALLYLVVSLLAVAVDMYLLGAPFLAAMEVIIYAGAIMVLFVFAIMILGAGSLRQTEAGELPRVRLRAWLGPSILAAVLGLEVVYLLVRGSGGVVAEPVPAEAVGRALYGPYLIGVELASFLLLAGLIGAFHLGRRGPRRGEAEEP